MNLYSCLIVAVIVGACGQETRTTTQNADLCDPAACDGPNPYGIPNWECADGSIAGPACLEGDDGACAWGIRECPDDDECTPDECGVPPGAPNWICDDGSIGGPACLHADDGTCGWQIVECPEAPPCAWDDCPDPAPGAPNYLCDDGETVAGPACAPDDAGACGWTFVECPAGG